MCLDHGSTWFASRRAPSAGSDLDSHAGDGFPLSPMDPRGPSWADSRVAVSLRLGRSPGPARCRDGLRVLCSVGVAAKQDAPDENRASPSPASRASSRVSSRREGRRTLVALVFASPLRLHPICHCGPHQVGCGYHERSRHCVHRFGPRSHGSTQARRHLVSRGHSVSR